MKYSAPLGCKDVATCSTVVDGSVEKTLQTKSFLLVLCYGSMSGSIAKFIRRRDLGLKSYPKDWRNTRSNSRHLVYKESCFTTTQLRLRS